LSASICLVAVASVAAGSLYALRDSTPARPTFSDVTCSRRSGRVVITGTMHVQAAGRHDYLMEPLFRLDGGRLEHHYDRMFYDIGQGADIAWHASVAPNWPGTRITYCSARGAALVGHPEDD
jgi:hypothetical protein